MVTPHVDALASESLLLEKNYVQQAVCSPTRTSLLTGRRPDTTQVWDLYTSALPYPPPPKASPRRCLARRVRPPALIRVTCSYFRDLGHNYTTIPEFFRLQGYETVGG